MNPQVPRLHLAHLDSHIQKTQSKHGHPLDCQASDLMFSVNMNRSPQISSSEELSPCDDDERFQHVQDSFRQLLHRKSSAHGKDALRAARRQTVTEPPALTRRETNLPRSLFDAEDSARVIIRRLSVKRLGSDKRRWTLVSTVKSPMRIYVASASSTDPSLQSAHRPAPSSSESCTIL